MSVQRTIGFLGAGKIYCVLVAGSMLVAGCGTSKLYPQAPMRTNTLQALVGTNVVMQSGVISSDDPTTYTQIIELKTASGAYIAG